MANRYNGAGAAAVGVDKTILTLISAAGVRPELYDILVGSAAAPAAQASKFYLQRFTAVGTEGSGFTPVALDPASPAAECDCGVGTFAVEPTYTADAILLQISLNQQATGRWCAARPGAGLIAPATANNGIGCKTSTATGVAVHEACFHWEE